MRIEHTTLSRERRERRAVVCRLSSVVCILLSLAGTLRAGPVPFTETFEDAPAGMASNLVSDWNGQNAWVTSPTNAGSIVTSPRHAGAKAGRMEEQCHLSRTFGQPGGTNVWVDFYARVPAATRANQSLSLSSDSALGFYFNSDSNIVATSGDLWITNTVAAYTNGQWVRITVNLDYRLEHWSMYIASAGGNALAENVFTNLAFRSVYTSNFLGKFAANGSLEKESTYFDNFSVARDNVEGMPAHIDKDSDQLSDRWELEWFGDLSESGTNDFDGDNHTDLSEYVAGTDPTNSMSYMRILDVDISASNSAHVTVQWEGGGYSVTSFYAGDAVSRSYRLMASDDNYNAATTLVATVAEGSIASITNTWEDTNAADLYESRFYNVVLADYAGISASSSEDWAMFKQPRTASKRYLMCVPVNYEGTNNNLNAKLGQHLGRGLYSTNNHNGDHIELFDETGLATPYYWDSGAWVTFGGAPADVEITSGQAFWLVRTANAAQDRTNAVFAGRVWKESSVSNVTINTKAGTTNGWTLVGWNMANQKTVERANSNPNQLGFYSAGAKGATIGDWSQPANIGDMIYMWHGGAWRQAWLIDDGTGVTSYNGRWWDQMAWDYLDWTFKPGDAFWYYHTDNGSATNFTWTPEP